MFYPKEIRNECSADKSLKESSPVGSRKQRVTQYNASTFEEDNYGSSRGSKGDGILSTNMRSCTQRTSAKHGPLGMPITGDASEVITKTPQRSLLSST
jgi:hypothetical protein